MENGERRNCALYRQEGKRKRVLYSTLHERGNPYLWENGNLVDWSCQVRDKRGALGGGNGGE